MDFITSADGRIGYIYLARMMGAKIRNEKNCLNCGHEVADRYCPHCGQENLELHESSLHLVIHYFQDLFHYDGRLWHTLSQLFRKPGSAAVEYMEGKRRANLEPIRFYVFASTVFFILLYFSVGSLKDSTTVNTMSGQVDAQAQLEQLLIAKEAAKGTRDTVQVNALIDSLRIQMMAADTLEQESDGGNVEFNLGLGDTSDLEDAGPFVRWFLKRLSKKEEELRLQYGDNDSKALAGFIEEVFHEMPKLIFLSLPFFALLLKLFYWRSHRKLYVEHFIFSIYLYSFFFTLFSAWLLIQVGLNGLGLTWPDGQINWLNIILALYPFFYLILAMKRFYADRWRFLIFRFLFLVLFFWILIIILFLIMASFTLLF